MADTAVAAPTKAPKKKTAAKPKKPSDHPKYRNADLDEDTHKNKM
jgi:hypothetical protein